MPVGVFDSGAGGLSVLRALEKRLPLENYIYFGDTARAPYGDLSPEEVRGYTLEIGRWLIGRGCKAIVVACNTATVWGMAALSKEAPIPVYGMIDAAMAGVFGPGGDSGSLADEAGEADETGEIGGTDETGEIGGADETGALSGPDESQPVGLIATQGTLASGVYQAAFADRAPGRPLYARACPDFTLLVEKGVTEGRTVDQAVSVYLTDLRDKKICALILGCTHYPFLAPAIASFLGGGVKLIDPAVQLASIVEGDLKKRALLNDGKGNGGASEFWCSGAAEAFREAGSRLLGRPIAKVKRRLFLCE